jgi:prophage DNA circulation protein
MKQASFRGVPFHVESAELSGGRRTVMHEYPLQDVGFSEDLGRKAREFPVQGYVVGDDYMDQRDALLQALEEKGPGELLHPYYGTRRVSVSDFRVREASANGGMATFSITFSETEAAPTFPVATPDAQASLASSAKLSLTSAMKDFLARYQVAGLPLSALDSAAGVVSSAADSMGQALGPLVGATQYAAKLKSDLDGLMSNATTLVREPADVLGGLVDVVASFGALPISAELGARGMLRAYGFTPPTATPPDTTPTRQQELANFDALIALIRTALVVQAAVFTSVAEFDNYDSAVALRDDVSAALDEQLELASDDTFAQLADLRADLVRAVPGANSDLPHLARHTPAATVPSLVLAHRLYGDVARELDLVARNRVAHPGFVRGGVELEVLSDGG